MKKQEMFDRMKPIDATIDYIATWLAKNKGQPSGEDYADLKRELYNFASFVADELRGEEREITKGWDNERGVPIEPDLVIRGIYLEE